MQKISHQKRLQAKKDHKDFNHWYDSDDDMEVAEQKYKVHFRVHDMKNPSEDKLCQELKTILKWLQKEDKYAKLGMWAKTETIKNPSDIQVSSIKHILESKKNEKAGFSGTLLVRSTQDFHSLKREFFPKLQTRKIIL